MSDIVYTQHDLIYTFCLSVCVSVCLFMCLSVCVSLCVSIVYMQHDLIYTFFHPMLRDEQDFDKTNVLKLRGQFLLRHSFTCSDVTKRFLLS